MPALIETGEQVGDIFFLDAYSFVFYTDPYAASVSFQTGMNSDGRVFFAELIGICQQVVDNYFALNRIAVQTLYGRVGYKDQVHITHGELILKIIQYGLQPVIESDGGHTQNILFHFHFAHIQNHVNDVFHLACLFESPVKLATQFQRDLLAGGELFQRRINQG